MHVITPSDLKKFQVKHYSDLLLKPQFEGQEKFLNNEITQLQNENSNNDPLSWMYNIICDSLSNTQKERR